MERNTSSDEELAALVAQRGRAPSSLAAAQAALGELYERYAKRLAAYLFARLARSDVDDAAQAVWQRVWEKLPGRQAEGNFAAWLFAVAGNYVIDQRRKKRPDLFADETALPSSAAKLPDELLIHAEYLRVFEQCLAKLAEMESELVRRRMQGQDYARICRELELSETKAHKMFFNSKQRLKECVEQHWS